MVISVYYLTKYHGQYSILSSHTNPMYRTCVANELEMNKSFI